MKRGKESRPADKSGKTNRRKTRRSLRGLKPVRLLIYSRSRSSYCDHVRVHSQWGQASVKRSDNSWNRAYEIVSTFHDQLRISNIGWKRKRDFAKLNQRRRGCLQNFCAAAHVCRTVWILEWNFWIEVNWTMAAISIFSEFRNVDFFFHYTNFEVRVLVIYLDDYGNSVFSLK